MCSFVQMNDQRSVSSRATAELQMVALRHVYRIRRQASCRHSTPHTPLHAALCRFGSAFGIRMPSAPKFKVSEHYPGAPSSQIVQCSVQNSKETHVKRSARRPTPEDSIMFAHPRSLDRSLEYCQLVPECEILRCQGCPADEECLEKCDDRG